MIVPTVDDRSAERRMLDEAIAAKHPLPPPTLPTNAHPLPMEAQMACQRRPVAMAGIVENGVVRLLDSSIRLPEHARVIIVASE